MPGNLLHVDAVVNCQHGAKASITSTNQRVKVSGKAVAVLSDMTSVSGCPFQVPGPTPQPCVMIKWTVAAMRVKVNGQAVLLSDSQGLCQSAQQAPQGSPMIATTQIRVKGT